MVYSFYILLETEIINDTTVTIDTTYICNSVRVAIKVAARSD